MPSRTLSADSISMASVPTTKPIEVNSNSSHQLEAPSSAVGPSTSLLRAHSLSPSHSKMLRPKTRPRSTTATSTQIHQQRQSTIRLNWWTTTTNGGGGGGGLMAMLQRALCSGNGQPQQRGQYRTVLTRESPDSGLELDRMEAGIDGQNNNGKKMPKAMEDGNGSEEDEEKEDEDKQESKKNKKQNSPPPSSSSSPITSSSFGRLLSSFLANRPSLLGRTNSSMFDFPSSPPLLFTGPLDPNGYAQSSPISQLSRANAVLMAENQQLANRIEELEHALRDHVAHLNSIYYTLHQRHGFDALQLPNGELVRLSQFKGPEVVLLTFVGSGTPPHDDNGSIEAINGGTAMQNEELLRAASNRRNRLQIQHKIQQNGEGRKPVTGDTNSHSPSISGGSSCSFVSASSDSSLDPVEMFHQLCIRSKTELAEDDRQQIQAYMDWLKSGGGHGEEDEAHRLLAKLRAQQVQAQVQNGIGNGPINMNGQSAYSPSTSNNSSSTILASGHFHSMENGTTSKKKREELLNGWRNARSEGSQQATGSIQTKGSDQIGKGQMENGTHQNGQSQQLCAQLSESNRSLSPRFGGGTSTNTTLSKDQRIRSQYTSGTYLQTRRMVHTLGGSYGTSALMSGNHHAAGNASGGTSSHEERSPRRGGIGLVSACRNTLRANNEHQRKMNGSRNLI